MNFFHKHKEGKMQEQKFRKILITYRCIKSICMITLTIAVLLFVGNYIWQVGQEYSERQELELYYSGELEYLYTKCYEVDENGSLVWSQYGFEKAHNALKEQMLADGFNRAKIQIMENVGRAKGQESRRFWDGARKKNKTEKSNTSLCLNNV